MLAAEARIAASDAESTRVVLDEAINEALAFHQAIGTERVAARLRYLTLRWANKLKTNPRVIIHTGLDQVYGVACVGIKDIPAPRINAFMWDKYRIITTAITRPRSSSTPRRRSARTWWRWPARA